MTKHELRWWLPLVILAVISSTGMYQWWLNHSSQTAFKGDYIDIIAEHVQLQRFDEQGRLIQVIQSPAAQHYALSKSTHFNHPRMWLYPTQAGRSVWQLNAGLGILSGAKDRLDLSASVDMHEVVSQGKRLQTTAMTWYVKDKVAVTDKAVVGTEPGVVVTAVGARFEQAKGLIYLLSQVKAEYHP